MYKDVVAKYPDDEVLQYIWRENPSSMELGYWNNHFELEFFKSWAPKDSTILDYGCGMGCLDMQLVLAGYNVFGYDLSEGEIAVARYTAELNHIPIAFYDKLPDRYYDRIWMCHVLEHIPTSDFSSVFGQLKPVPTLISVPCGKGYDSPYHVNHWWSTHELAEAVAPFARIVWSQYFPNRSVLRLGVVPGDVA